MLRSLNPLTVTNEVSNTMPSNGIDLDSITEGFANDYFSQTLKFCVESRRELYKANTKFYRTIVESGGNEVIVHEGFGDFFATVRNIIDKFLDFIKKLFNKFVTALNSFIKSEGYLKKHKEDFAKFDSNCNFTMDGYKFTITPEIPAVDAKATWANNSFFVDTYDSNTKFSFDTQNNKKLNDTIKGHLDTLNKSIETGDWFDRFRAEVLGRSNDIIYQEEFADELFREYRDGESTSSELDITASEVTESLNRFTNHDTTLSQVKKTKERIDREYNEVKKHLDKMLDVNYSGGNKSATVKDPEGNFSNRSLTGDEITQMDLYIKAKINQVQQMSNIHALAFSAKIDAVNDCFKQDKNLLYKALAKINAKVNV